MFHNILYNKTVITNMLGNVKEYIIIFGLPQKYFTKLSTAKDILIVYYILYFPLQYVFYYYYYYNKIIKIQ